MKTKQAVIAVFDIGKTNKKLLVFNENYEVVSEESSSFNEDLDDDGFPCENISQLSSWVLSRYNALQKSEDFRLKAVNFSTYGASLVYIDDKGSRTAPLYNYLKPYPEEVLAHFLQTYGGKETFSVETSSPVMGHLNAGLQLYWFKNKKSQLFERTINVVHFPQYLSFLITGKRFAEMTNLGCHSGMWNFHERKYHHWLQQERILSKMCPVNNGNYTVMVENDDHSDSIAVGIGLHDSSAAIIPYLSAFREPFVIVSTGTWMIGLNPFNYVLPTADELNKGCVSYLSYEGKPVKVSMLFAGHDHDQQLMRIADYFHCQESYIRSLPYDAELIHSETDDNKVQYLSLNNTQLNTPTEPCVFHLRELSDFTSASQAYHQLLSDLVERQVMAITLILSKSPEKCIYVDGGFSKNQIYMQLLANAFPAMEVYSTSMMQGTALGAALAIHDKWNTTALPGQLIHLTRWFPVGHFSSINSHYQ